MKKLLSLVLALMLLLGCTSLASADEEVTLEFWIASNDESWFSAYDAVTKAYMASHPNVKINLNMYAWGEYFTKLTASFVGGIGPDVFAIGFAQFYTLADKGNMLDLTPYIPADWDGYGDIPKSILDMGSLDGKLHALLVPEGRSIYYRKDIADLQGVTEADLQITNFDTLIALADKLTLKEGNDTIMAGIELSTTASSSPEQTTYITGRMEGAPNLWNADLTGNFNHAAFATALAKAKAMVDRGTMLLQTPGLSYFNTDASAMIISSQNQVEPQLAQLAELGGEVGIIPLPAGTNVLLGQWYAVNKDTKKAQYAADFLLYLNSVEGETILIDQMGQVPNRTSLGNYYCNGNEMRTIYFNSLMSDAQAYGPVANGKFLTWINDYRSACEASLAGTMGVQEALDSFMAKYAAIMSE
ncbi:MAG: extracellular solute-binding protein [Clostridia bacterium]|nr:extracellular solute-binding protein [Clostridia bacterium]